MNDKIILTVCCAKGHEIKVPYDIDHERSASMLINKDFIGNTIYEFCPKCKIITTFIVTDVIKYSIYAQVIRKKCFV